MILLWGFTEKSDFFLGGGATRTKRVGWGVGEVGQFSDLRGEGSLLKRGGVLSLPFWETECMRRRYQTADSQTNINFSENGCITAEIPQMFIKRMNSD